jgi:transglutaminase-like putative cysteine protease
VTSRWSGLLPLACAALALGNSAAWPLALVVSLALVLPLSAGPRFDVDLGRQLLSSAIGAGAGYVLASLAYEAEPGRLGDVWARLCAAALAAAAARALLIAPRGGPLPAVALAFLGLAFAGKVASPAYPLCVVLFLLSLPWALHAGEPRWPSRRRAAAGIALIGLALLLGGGSTLGLHRLQAWSRGRTRLITPLWQARTGFSENMELGALDGLLDSDRRVLRVRGERLDYLRGTSLDVYELGSWRRSDAAERETEVRLEAAPATATHEIELIGPRRDRLFLPLAARAVHATPSAALIDDLGSVRAPQKKDFERVRFASGARESLSLARPRPEDLRLPRRLRPQLQELVREWTRDVAGEAQVLHAIEQHLARDFSYSRQVSRSLTTDPVLDFLLRDRRGHCEYFASALALLARAAGIPARIVMGYRVSERSPFGYYVVRERNAHAWVETWLEGEGWSAHDATPAEAQPYNREHEASYAAAGVDALGLAYDELTDWLGRRSLLETSLAWVVGCAVLALIVARGVRRQRPRATPAEDELPLPFMQQLLAALARRGHTRRADEPLEQLAARLPDAPTRNIILRYAALRYGGRGDREALASEAEAAARALGPRP